MAVITQETLGDHARGTFGAGKRADPASLKKVTDGTYMQAVTQPLIGVCSDDRCDVHGSRILLPAAFGGFASLVVADALTTRVWYRPGMSFEGHAAVMFKALRDKFPGAMFMLHTDTDALVASRANGEQECGCAAVAQAAAVVQLLSEDRDLIEQQYLDSILVHAQELLRNRYFKPGTAAMMDRLEAIGLKKEILTGLHEGAVLFKNRRTGTILNRPQLYRALEKKGLPPLYLFEYDQWALRESAERIIESPKNSGYFFAGGDALNMATIRAIGAKELLVVTFE